MVALSAHLLPYSRDLFSLVDWTAVSCAHYKGWHMFTFVMRFFFFFNTHPSSTILGDLLLKWVKQKWEHFGCACNVYCSFHFALFCEMALEDQRSAWAKRLYSINIYLHLFCVMYCVSYANSILVLHYLYWYYEVYGSCWQCYLFNCLNFNIYFH